MDYITKPFVIGALQRKIKAMFAMLEHHKPAKDIYDDGRLFLDFSEPVSYTHLDVYKRQGWPGSAGEVSAILDSLKMFDNL